MKRSRGNIGDAHKDRRRPRKSIGISDDPDYELPLKHRKAMHLELKNKKSSQPSSSECLSNQQPSASTCKQMSIWKNIREEFSSPSFIGIGGSVKSAIQEDFLHANHAFDKAIQEGNVDFLSPFYFKLPKSMGEVDTLMKRDAERRDFKPEILSIVVGVNINVKIDLRIVAQKGINLEYNPDRFAPLIMRIKNPKATCLIFNTGRLVVIGTQSTKDCYKACTKFGKTLQKMGFGHGVEKTDVHVENISASCNLGFRVQLAQMASSPLIQKLVNYEPEMFPGLVYPIHMLRLKTVVFTSGSVLITGARSVQDCKAAMDHIFRDAVKFYI